MKEVKEEIRNILFKFLGNLNTVGFKARNDEALTVEAMGEEVNAVFGLPEDAEALSGKGLFEYIHQQDQAYVRTSLEEGLKEGNKCQLIFRVTSRIKKQQWLWVQANGIFDADRNPVSIEGTITDITARKAAVDELKTEENFYQHILHTMPIELAVLSPEQRYIFCNKTAIPNEEVREWIIGKDDFDYCHYRNKDVSIAWERHRNFKKVMAQKREMEWEEIFPKKDGSKIYALRRLTPVYDEDGDLQMMLGYGFDITERRVAEEQAKENERLLKSLNANIQDGIYRYSPAKGFLYVNDAFVNIFNYASRDSLLNDANGFFARDKTARKALIDIGGKSGSFNNKEVLFNQNEEAVSFWGLVNCNKRIDEEGDAIYDGGIADITELKGAEHLLKEKNEELLKTNHELDRFIYSASHDLRAPLTSILGIVKVAEEEFQESELQHYLEMIRKSVNKLDHFVNDLIDYYRNSRSDTSTERINFDKLIRESFETFQYMNGADRVRLEIDNQLKQPFYSDAYRLKVLFNNLLSNAIKYQKPGIDDPFVKVSVEEAKEDALVITIADNGLGIEQAKLDNIFEMFYRAYRYSEGSGLGLYIAKEAVDKLGGTMTVDAEPEKGTTFRITINNATNGE